MGLGTCRRASSSRSPTSASTRVWSASTSSAVAGQSARSGRASGPLQLDAHRGQRAAELVGCVGGELALALGGRSEPVEQLVHRRAEADHLVRARRHPHSAPTISRADRRQLGAHRLDGAEGPPHAPPRDRPHEDDDERQHGDEADGPHLDGVVGRLEACRHVHLERPSGLSAATATTRWRPAGPAGSRSTVTPRSPSAPWQFGEPHRCQRRGAGRDDAAVGGDDLGHGVAVSGDQRRVLEGCVGDEPGDVLGASFGKVLAAVLDRRVEHEQQRGGQRGEGGRHDDDRHRRHPSAHRAQRPPPADGREPLHAGTAIR